VLSETSRESVETTRPSAPEFYLRWSAAALAMSLDAGRGVAVTPRPRAACFRHRPHRMNFPDETSPQPSAEKVVPRQNGATRHRQVTVMASSAPHHSGYLV